MQTKIDILIPIYNCKEKLKITLDSLTQQNTYNRFNVIIIDNNSDEDYTELLKNYFYDIQFFKNTSNVGRIGNWNKCLNYANNKWSMFLF